eukprot:5279071-Pleurochrysis_carterae.AAC.2
MAHAVSPDNSQTTCNHGIRDGTLPDWRASLPALLGPPPPRAGFGLALVHAYVLKSNDAFHHATAHANPQRALRLHHAILALSCGCGPCLCLCFCASPAPSDTSGLC